MVYIVFQILLGFLAPVIYCQIHIEGVNRGNNVTVPDPNDKYYLWIQDIWNTSNRYPDDWFTHVELHDTFVIYDYDHDGVITRREYTHFVEYYAPDLLLFANGLYDIYDSNGDHHLDFNDLGKLYDEMDGDGDGMVVQSEFFAFWNKVLHQLEPLHGGGQLLG